ncbi:MAG: hypothetical protein KAI29_01625, partial [Cyclobacteriaceae bacterium]|nr:hypothetical protein [Cyclobacteriaceae bacterium]
LIDSAIKFGSQEENYQISEDTGNWQLFEPCTENVFVIGNFLSPDVALKDEVKQIFAELFAVEGLLVIEHILLRKRTVDEDYLPVQLNNPGECNCPEAKDPYSFRVSIILPSWSERFQHIRFRQFVEETIRMETPAHIYPRICWINHCEMQKLEECHESWLTQHSEITENYRGCLPLVDTNVEDFPEDDKAKLELYQNAQKALIEKLYNLTNVFPTARLHDCKTVDEDNPQITLNDTNLGTL